MIVDKHSIIDLKRDEIRLDFMQEVCKSLVRLRELAFSRAEYDKVNEMASLFAEELYEFKKEK